MVLLKRKVKGGNLNLESNNKNNRRFAKIGGLVELALAFIKHYVQFKTCRYLALEKNQEHFNLIVACANLRRVPKYSITDA